VLGFAFLVCCWFEISLAVVLSVGAGLLLRSFQQAERLDPGFFPTIS